MRLCTCGIFICFASSAKRVPGESSGGTLAGPAPRTSATASQPVAQNEDAGGSPGRRRWTTLDYALLPVEKAPYTDTEAVAVAVHANHGDLTRLLIALSLSAVFIAVFLVRCYLGLDLTSLALEMVFMLVLFCATYALFL